MLSSRLLEVCELARHLLLLNTWPTVLVMAALGSSISASLAMTNLGALVFVVCSLANVVLGVGIMATLNVSRAAGAGSGAAGSGWQRLAAVRLGLASAGAAAQHSGGSVAVSPPGASRAGQVGAGRQAAAPWAGAAAQRLAWQPGSVALPLSVAAGAGQAGSDWQGGVPCRPGGAERTGVPGGPGGEVQAARQVY